MSKVRTAKNTSLKCLRVGLIQDGQIHDERVFHSPQTITIGEDASNTFVVTDARLPKTFALLVAEKSGYRLQALEGMHVRLTLANDAQFTLTSKPDDKRFTPMADGYSVVLNDESRGKIVLDDLTLLFQFVDQPDALVDPSMPPAPTASTSALAPLALPEGQLSVEQATDFLQAAERQMRQAKIVLDAAKKEMASAETMLAEARQRLNDAQRRAAEERARREAEEKARREAEARAKREAEERAAREREEAERAKAAQLLRQSEIKIAAAATTSTPMQLPYREEEFFGNTDRLFGIVLLATFLVNFGTVFAISMRPSVEPVELTLEDIPQRFASVIIPDKPKEEALPVEDAPGDDQAPSEAPKEAVKEAKANPSPAKSADPTVRRAAIREGIQGKGLLKMLGALGGESGEGVQDVFGDGHASSNSIADALAGASGVGFADADSIAAQAGQRLGGGSGEAAGIGDLEGADVRAVVAAREFKEKKAVAIKGRVIDEGPEIDSSTCDRDAIARFVKTRLKAIQTCYEKQLKMNPTLKGKIVVSFTINEAGRTTNIGFEENSTGSPEVESCIRSTIRMWIFPIKDNECPVAYPFIFSPST